MSVFVIYLHKEENVCCVEVSYWFDFSENKYVEVEKSDVTHDFLLYNRENMCAKE